MELRRLCSDAFLWALVIVFLLTNTGGILYHETASDVCKAANGLILEYGSEITPDSLSKLEEAFLADREIAENRYFQQHSRTTTDLSELYLDDEQILYYMQVWEQMISYGQQCLSQDKAGCSFVAASFCGVHTILYQRLFPIILMEILILTLFLALKALETEYLFKTAFVVFSTRRGRLCQLEKLIAVLILLTGVFWLLFSWMLLAFSYYFPNCLSSSIPAAAQLSTEITPIAPFSQLRYCLFWIVAAYGVTLIFFLVCSAAGLVSKDSYRSLLLSFCIPSLLVGAIPFGFSHGNPVALLLGFDGEQLYIRTGEWFLQGTASPVNMLSTMALWLLLCGIALAVAWRYFKRKDLQI